MIGPIRRGPIIGGPAVGATGSGAIGGSATAAGDDAKLRKAARQLEGIFTQQLFKAMRETVPEDQGAIGGSSAQDMFTSMLDEHLAADPKTASARGVGEAIYRHLTRTRGVDAATPATPAVLAMPVAPALTVTPAAPGASLRTTARGTTPRPTS